MTITETKPLTIDDMYAIVSSFRKEHSLPEPTTVTVHCGKYGVTSSIHLATTLDQLPSLGPAEKWDAHGAGDGHGAFHARYLTHAGAPVTVYVHGVPV